MGVRNTDSGGSCVQTTFETTNTEISMCKVRYIARSLTTPTFKNQVEEGKLTNIRIAAKQKEKEFRMVMIFLPAADVGLPEDRRCTHRRHTNAGQ